MREHSTTTTTLPHETKWKDTPSDSPKGASATGVLEKTSDKIHDVAGQASAAAHDWVDKAKERIADTSDAAKTRYVEIKENAALKGAEAKKAVQSSFERRPLAYVAGALIAGVAIGMALPRSRAERQTLSSSGQKLREAAGNAKREAMQAAEAATAAATDTFQKELSGDDEKSEA